jgi:hypothetical protein
LNCKKGYCVDCDDELLKPIIAGRCNYHYKIYRSQFWKVKESKPKNKIKPISNKQALRIRKYSLIRNKYVIDNPLCKMNVVVECTYYTTEVHHSKGKTGDLLFDIRYFVPGCAACHRWVEVHPAEAYKLGLSVERLVDN